MLRRICAGSIALFAGLAQAQTTITKADNQMDLSLADSWLGGVGPSLSDTALWDSTVTTANTVALGADLAWFGLRLTNPGGAVTINAGNTLTLGGGGIDMAAATQDLTLHNALTLGASQTWNVGAGRTLTVTGLIGDSGSFLGFTKGGAGTLTLEGANTYTGPTVVDRGALRLNFAAPAAPESNIINATSTLQLGGGSLVVQGAADETNSQTFASTVFNAGLSAINVAPGASGQATLGLGTISAAIDAVVRFTGGGAVTATSATTGTGGILGANGATAINVASAGYGTVGLDDFAALSNGTIVGGSTVAGFYQNTYGNNFDMTSNTVLANGGAQRGASTVRFNTPGATTLTGGTGNLVTFGAALITPNMGANNASLTGAGTWQIIRQTSPNGPQQGTIWQNNVLGFYSVTIPITDGREGTADPSRVVKAGLGTAVFSGANTYTGRTSIYEGTLMIGADNNLGGASAPVFLRGGTLFGNASFSMSGTRAFNLQDTGGLAASTGYTMTVSGVIGGTGALTIGASVLAGTGPGTANPTPIIGDGRVVLTADNTYSGPTTVSFGSVSITGINALGGANYGGLTLTNGGVLHYANALTSGSDVTIGNGLTLGADGGSIDTNGNNVTFGNGLRGSGGLIKTGAGALTLNAAGSYLGDTVINGGSLRVAAPTGSATGLGNITVNSGGILTGAGTLAGSVIVNAGGTLEPGTGVGTLILPGLTIGADAVLKFEFNSTPANDFIQVTGLNGLTIGGGKVNVLVEGSGSPFATAGTYNLFSFNGGIQGVGTDAFAVVNPAAGFAYTFATNNNFITLTVATSGLVTAWTSPVGGSWGTAGNWSNGSPNEIGATAIFGNALTAAGMVTLDGAKTVGSASFDSPNSYTIGPGVGGTITFQTNTGSANLMVPLGSHTITAPVTLGSNLIAEIGAGSSMTLTAEVSGSRSITKRGAGVLSLLSANTYSGDTTIEAGTVGVGAAAALGMSVVLVPGSATIRADADGVALGNNLVISSGATATVDTQANNLTLSGIVSDATTNGTLRKAGTGSLTLSGANTYSGGTVVAAGTLIVNSIVSLSTGPVTFAGDATLQQLSALTLPNAVNLNLGATATINTNGHDMVLGGNIVGAGGTLAKSGLGVLTLNGANDFGTSGAAQLRVSEGSVVFGTPAAAPAGIALQTIGGTIDLNGLSIAAGSLSGSGGVITDNGTLGGVTTLTVNQAINTSYSGAINNGLLQTLALTKTGAGTLALSGNNSFSGVTNANGGNLQLDANGVMATSALNITSGGFTLNGGALTVAGVTGLNYANGATLTILNGDATLTGGIVATSNATNRYLIHVQAGTVTTSSIAMGRTGLNFSAEPAAGAVTDGLYIQGGNVTVAGTLAMSTTNGANSSVSTRIDGGSLSVGGPVTIGLNNAGRWSILDVNGGTFTSSDAATGVVVGGPLAGSAIFTVRAGTATVERIQLASLTGATSVVSVTGGTLHVGSGGIELGPANSGTTSTRFGNAVIGAKASWSSSLPISLIGTTTFQAADAGNAPRDINLSGVLSEFGPIVKTGGGALTLSGANTYFGGTTINGGLLSVNTLAPGGQPSGIGASSGDAFNLNFNGGALRYTGVGATTDRSFTVGVAGATLEAAGTGALKFTSSNAVQFVEADLAHTITLTGANSGDNSLANIIGDSGIGATTVVKDGVGTWSLSGANLYSGGTIVNAGLLKAENIIGSATGIGAVSVGSGAALGGSGKIAGIVTINTGARLVPGSSVGTLTLGGVTLAADSVLDFEFNGTPSNDLVVVTEANGLTLNGGGFNLFAEGSQSKWTSPGTYNLLQYSGTLGGSAGNLSVLNPQNGLSYTFGTNGGFVTLTIGTSVIFSNWIPTGGGSWNTVTNWSSGIPNAVDAAANFLGALTAPGTVTLDGAKTVGTLQFNNNNSYTIGSGTGGTLTLSAGAGSAQITNLNGSHTVSAPVILASNTAVDVTNSADILSLSGTVSGTGSLTKNAVGVLRLSGANTYSGGTAVNGGVVEIATNTALGTGSIAFNSSATLRAGAADLAAANAIAIGNNAIASVNTGAHTLVLSGIISSVNATGGVTKVGTGTLALGDANTYTGPTSINAGTIEATVLADGGVASSIGQSSNAAGNLMIDGGVLRYAGIGAATTDRQFTVGPNGATLDASGVGTLNFNNPGAAAFAGVNTTPVITLTGTNDGANTLAALIGNNGSGTTALHKAGPGNWLLGGTNTYSGQTVISGGILAVGNPLALQRSTLNYDNHGGALGFGNQFGATLGGLTGSQNLELANSFGAAVELTVGANNSSTTYGGVLSGFGGLTKVGTGTLILAGKNTYSGPTVISAGVLKALAADALSPATTVAVNVPGGLHLGDGSSLGGNITAAVGANEFVDVPDAGATATLSGTLGVAGGGNQFRLGIGGAGSTLNVTGGLNLPNAASIVFVTRGNLVFSGSSVSNVAAGITFGRSGQALNVTFKDNAIANIAGGSGFGGGQANPSIAMTIQDSAAVNFGGGLDLNASTAAPNQTTVSLNGGTLAVAGFFKSSGGSNQLTSLNFNGGTLRAAAGSPTFLPAFNGLTANVQAGGARIDTNGVDITISQALVHDASVATDGGLTKSGAGTLTLSGDNTYNGITEVSAGTLLVSGSLSGTSAIAISGGGSIGIGAANRINDIAAITLDDGGIFNTAGFNEAVGTLTLAGDAVIDLGAGASVLRFANSAATLWNAGLLTIAGWSGSLTGQGTDAIFVGTDANALTASQVSQIRFLDPIGLAPGMYEAEILTTGELVAVPEPGSVALLLGGLGSLLMRRRRKA